VKENKLARVNGFNVWLDRRTGKQSLVITSEQASETHGDKPRFVQQLNGPHTTSKWAMDLVPSLRPSKPIRPSPLN
jgi:hypothetical protein